MKKIALFTFNCTQLQVVSFESNSKLKEIGGACSWEPHGAFSNCIALSAIEIPSTVTTIGVAAFFNLFKFATNYF